VSVETIVFSILSTNAAVGALIGVGGACKVYPDEIPQGVTMPAVSYEIVAGVPEGVMNGAPVADDMRIQINAYANDDRDAARALSEAIERAFEDLDVMIEKGCGIRCISWNGVDFDDELKRYRDSKDYRFWTSR